MSITPQGDAILLADSGFTDQGETYGMVAGCADIVPAGIGGEAVFYVIRMSGENIALAFFDVVPVLDGQRLDPITVQVPGRPGATEPDVFLVEIPLYQKYVDGGTEKMRYGLRGTYFSFEVQYSPDVDESFKLLEADVEHEVVRESMPRIVYYEEPSLRPATCPLPETAFFGTLGSNQIGADGAGTDFGVPFAVRCYAHAIMPDGADGEAIFPQLYLLTTRNNPADVTVLLTSYLKTYATDVRQVVLPAVADPISDIQEIPVPQSFYVGFLDVGRNAMRGVRFAFQLDVDGPFDGELIFEAGEIEVEVVRESQRGQVA
jgi:hypothetical protein